MLLNERMGHIGEKGLRAMHKKCMVEYFPEFNLEVNFCEHCIYGKQSRVRFPSRATMEKGILELAHSDVVWPYFNAFTWWIPILCLLHRLFFQEDMDIFPEEEIKGFLRNSKSLNLF